MIGHVAIAIALPGFNDLGHLVTSIFPFMNHFLYSFAYIYQKKKNKIHQLEI